MSKQLKDLFIRPDFDNSKVEISFSPIDGMSDFKWQILDEGSVVSEGNIDDFVTDKVCFEVKIDGFKPWHIHTPFLYRFKMEYELSGERVCENVEFGMRKIHISNDAVYVNNEKFYVKGFIRGREAHDHPNLENLPLEEYYAKNIRMAKKYGFNFIRFHSRIPDMECFKMADKLGIFIHVELRKYYGKYQKERALMSEGSLLDEGDWTDMVQQIRNHPSLMVYCMGNEIDHPGRNPRCKRFYEMTKELDPTRLFLDTCSRGEFDRKSVDLDVQHMSYFFPFGKNYGMYDNTQNWLITGSATGLPMIEQDDDDDPTVKVMRCVPAPRPVLAHEICHYVGLHDINALDEKFQKIGAEKPWWIDELKKLIKEKGHEENYSQMVKASRKFQELCWKLGFEAARRSKVISGFHFLQLSDTDRYENANGIIDCFDDSKGVDEKEFEKFNGDSVLLADLPTRTFFEGEKVLVPVTLSHFSPEISDWADFSFNFTSKESGNVHIQGGLKGIDLTTKGRLDICQIELKLPAISSAQEVTLTCCLTDEQGKVLVENNWELWIYPNQPEQLAGLDATVQLDDIQLGLRYPEMSQAGTMDDPKKLMITNRFSGQVLTHLENGGDVFMMYRVPITRDRKKRAENETFCLPTTWDRFKGTIWDRGHNCGAFIRENDALADFPNDGYINIQFSDLINDCDKICLDDFPVNVDPIIEAVDKAVRDRFDVYNFKLSELQPKYTMRKFAYLFELKVGKGRLLVSGFNFTGLNTGNPASCALFESLLKYIKSEGFNPKTEISCQDLEQFLLKKGQEPIVKERRMTQYWQLDEEPLESKKYWMEALEYIGEKTVVGDQWMNKKKIED